MVRKLRYERRVPLTQETLTAKLQVLGVEIDRSALARIETRDRLVKDSELLGLAKALGVSMERLFPRGAR
jgi:transcriptional regulator with XRE-family HTH domain